MGLIDGLINKALYRGKQQVLNKVGVGDASISNKVDDVREQGKLSKFLENHPSYTEESIKEYLKTVALEAVNKNYQHPADEKTIEKLMKDSKLDKMASMQIENASVNLYNENAKLLGGKIVFSDGRDQYWLFLRFEINGDEFKLNYCQMQKGMVEGF